MISSWLLRVLPESVGRRIAGRAYLLKVIDNTGWIFAERILRHTIGFVIGIWIARAVGPQEYGLLNYASAFVLVFAFLGTLGIDSIAVRDMLRDPKSRHETLGTLLLLRGAGGLVLMLVTAVAIALVKPHDPRASLMIVVISISQLLLATDAIDCWFQAVVASRYTVVARLAAFFAIAFVRIALIVTDAPIVAFAWANLAESALLTCGMLIAYRHSGQRLSSLQVSGWRAKSLLAAGWPLFLCALLVAVGQRFDQVLIGEMAGYSEVGAYAIAIRIIEATYILPAVIATSVFPAMIKSRALDNVRYEAQLQKLCNVVLWLGIAIAVPLSVLSGFIVHALVGNAYAGAATPLAILSWMPVLMFFSLVRQRWLLAEHAVSAMLALEVAACAMNVAANFLLIPRFGATGAAVAALIGAGGATLVVAPFSANARRSLLMMARGLAAPLRTLQRA